MIDAWMSALFLIVESNNVVGLRLILDVCLAHSGRNGAQLATSASEALAGLRNDTLDNRNCRITCDPRPKSLMDF
jgi:hypothetical protein